MLLHILSTQYNLSFNAILELKSQEQIYDV